MEGAFFPRKHGDILFLCNLTSLTAGLRLISRLLTAQLASNSLPYTHAHTVPAKTSENHTIHHVQSPATNMNMNE